MGLLFVRFMWLKEYDLYVIVGFAACNACDPGIAA